MGNEAFYQRMQGVASSVLARYGQGEVFLVRTDRIPGQVETPWRPGAVSTQREKLNAAVRAVEKKYIDGTLIVGTEVQATIAVPASEPKLSDLLEVDGRTRAIKRIIRIPEAGTPVAYVILAETA